MSVVNVILLAIVQGLAELLPVSSSAHVVVAEKLLGMDPSSPPMTLLLVMLHTGTIFAVIVYFWPQWRDTYFQSVPAFKSFAVLVVIASATRRTSQKNRSISNQCKAWATETRSIDLSAKPGASAAATR